MKRKGFTLIELLAVIVILAIIMVIAVPKILDVIESSRRNAAEVSIKLVKDAIKTQIASSEMMNSVFTKNGEGCYEFEFPEENENAEKLNVKNKENISGSIKYCNGRFEDDELTYEGEGSSPVNAVCKRATTLHTEICKSGSSCVDAGYTASGSKGTTTITYGSLGRKGKLTSGDAFDCDVTGEGDWERFYYVTSHGNNAVLIYYINVVNGVANNASKVAYDSSYQNWHGPRTGYQHLPSKTQWSNNKIIPPETRQIINQRGGTTTNNDSKTIESFTYTGKAARFLTAQEVNDACNITVGSYTTGELDSCNYLIENTEYSNSSLDIDGFWLETPSSFHDMDVWRVIPRNVSTNYAFDTRNGIRPVIEVAKKNISY